MSNKSEATWHPGDGPTPPEGPHGRMKAEVWGVVLDDAGSMDYYETLAEAWEYAADRYEIVRVVTYSVPGHDASPEVPHAELDIDGLVAAVNARPIDPRFFSLTLAEAESVLSEIDRLRAALSDSVPREQYDYALRGVDRALDLAAQHERERDEARAVIEQVRRLSEEDQWYDQRTSSDVVGVREVTAILDQAPADALARVKAEAGAQALDEFADWLRDCDDLTDGADGEPKGAEPGDGYWNNVYESHARARAAALREGAA